MKKFERTNKISICTVSGDVTIYVVPSDNEEDLITYDAVDDSLLRQSDNKALYYNARNESIELYIPTTDPTLMDIYVSTNTGNVTVYGGNNVYIISTEGDVSIMNTLESQDRKSTISVNTVSGNISIDAPLSKNKFISADTIWGTIRYRVGENNKNVKAKTTSGVIEKLPPLSDNKKI